MTEPDAGGGPQREVGGPQARVVIVNYNAGSYLARCVAALLAQTFGSFEAVIIDNASTDASLDGLPVDSRVRIDRLDRNIGFAAANNRAVAGAAAPYLVFLNPDAIAEPDWLERLVEAAQSSPDVQLLGSLQLQDDDPARIDGAGDVYFFAGTAWRHSRGAPREVATGHRPVFGACAAAALIRRDWFDRLGGFDEDYFCYFEDIDLAFRLRLLGGDVLQINDAVVHHAGSATTGTRSDFILYHTTRNQIWTFLKSMPAVLMIVLLPVHLALVAAKWVSALRQGRSRVVSRAIADALVALPTITSRRRAIQAKRKASSVAIARAITWSPSAFLRRAGAVGRSAAADRNSGGRG